MGIIYCITNTLNGKKYIGQTTKTLEKRWISHKSESKKHENKFYRAIRKYGFEYWTKEIIEEIENDLLNEREQYWISHFDTMNIGYNLRSGGGQNSLLSEESKKKISEKHMGKRMSIPTEFKKGLIPWNKGGTHSEETRKKLREKWKGRSIY